MRILSHYFIKRYLGLFSTVLAVAFLVLATIEMVLNLDDLSDFGDAPDTTGISAAGHGLRRLGIRLASYYLPDVLPIASFIAVFLTLALAGRARELLAIEAAGIRPLRVIGPILSIALILSLATTLLHETLILRAEQIASGEDYQERESINFGQEAFWYHNGPMITNVGYADAESRTLFEVEIFERGPSGSIVRVIRTDRVQIRSDGGWQMESAQIWQFDPSVLDRDPIVRRNVPLTLDIDTMSGDTLLAANPALLPLPSLARYLDSHPSDHSSAFRKIRERFNERLARPWLVLVFAWLAIPFALRVDHRGHVASAAVAGVVTLAFFFVAQTAGRTLAQQELIPAGITPWITIATFSLLPALALGLRLGRRRPRPAAPPRP